MSQRVPLLAGAFVLTATACNGTVAESSADAAPDSGGSPPDTSLGRDAFIRDADAPVAPYSASECVGPGSVIALWGDEGNEIFAAATHREPGAGPRGVLVSGLTCELANYSVPLSAHDTLSLSCSAPREAGASTWSVEFSTSQLGEALALKTYADVQRASFAAAGHAGLDVSGDSVGCGDLTGSFTITELAWDGDNPVAVTGVFEQHCDGLDLALRGCVHAERTP